MNHPCLPKWRKRIADAYVAGEFSEDDKGDAANWHCCAIDEAHEAFPNLVTIDADNATPADTKLLSLGLDFSYCVDLSLFNEANSVLDEIEKRLAEMEQR